MSVLTSISQKWMSRRKKKEQLTKKEKYGKKWTECAKIRNKECMVSRRNSR